MTTQETEGKFYEIVETAKKEGANLLMPSTRIEGLSDWHAPIVEYVQLAQKASFTPDGKAISGAGVFDPESNDIYAHDNAEKYLDKAETQPNLNKKWRLTKQALMKLSVCAGIIWSAEHCKRVDNRADRNYICYQAVGGVRKADGSPVFFKAEYDLDFEVMEAQLREQYEKKSKFMKDKDAKGKAEYVDFCVKRDLLQKRQHGLKLAEAGAMNRVVREILGLKQAYTQAELLKSFVMVRIVFKPDYNDKEVRAKLIDASIRAMTGIYGAGTITEAVIESAPIDVTPIEEEHEPTPGDTGDDGDVPNFTEPPPEPGEPTVPEPTPEPVPDSQESLLIDFQSLDAQGKEATLRGMAKTKSYDLDGFLKRSNVEAVRALTEAKRIELFKYLSGLPGKKAA